MEINYSEYCELVKSVFSEEFQRLEEYIYSIKNNYDCSHENYWIMDPEQGIPSMEEFKQVMVNFENVDILDEDTIQEIKAAIYSL
jgi:hypothetical protein